MDPFVHQLAELCRAHVTRAKWVFVPTHAGGRTIGERIALGGTNWLNLRFVTPLDAALRMGAPFLVERGINPSEELLEELGTRCPGAETRQVVETICNAERLDPALQDSSRLLTQIGATSRSSLQ